MKRLKVCWISNIPSPYKTAVMNLVGTETDLIALYEKHGFQRVGLRRNYYERPREDALIMTKFFELTAKP